MTGYSTAAVTCRYGYCAGTCTRSPTVVLCPNFPYAFTVSFYVCCFDFRLFMIKMYCFEAASQIIHSKQNQPFFKDFMKYMCHV